MHFVVHFFQMRRQLTSALGVGTWEVRAIMMTWIRRLPETKRILIKTAKQWRDVQLDYKYMPGVLQHCGMPFSGSSEISCRSERQGCSKGITKTENIMACEPISGSASQRGYFSFLISQKNILFHKLTVSPCSFVSSMPGPNQTVRRRMQFSDRSQCTRRRRRSDIINWRTELHPVIPVIRCIKERRGLYIHMCEAIL